MASKARLKEVYRFEGFQTLVRPLFLSRLSAGFPSPAEDYLDGWIDLNEHLIEHPAATFFARVAGDSMIDAGIYDGDTLIVDRALEAQDGHVVVARIDGEYTVKRIDRARGGLRLVAENPLYPALSIDLHQEFEVWGVVTYVIHRLSRSR